MQTLIQEEADESVGIWLGFGFGFCQDNLRPEYQPFDMSNYAGHLAVQTGELSLVKDAPAPQ